MLSVVSAAALSGISRFNCSTFPPPPVATDVKNLHPGHVQYVMAMGDSITAAFAARGKLQEDRDISWAIGQGTKDQLTLPWLLGQYSQSLRGIIGASTAPRIPKDVTHLPKNDYHPITDHLNVAESEGAIHRGSMDEQWGFLTEQTAKIKDFNAEGSWKVLTVWMTANDVCGKCDAPVNGTAYLEAWTAKTDELLTNVSTTMKNVYVNLISTLDLSNIARLQRTSVKCTVEHKVILKECGCIDRGNKTQLAQLDVNVHAFNAQLHAIASRWRAKLAASNRTDMAVILQPYQEGIGPTLDISFLNALDCFHPSSIAHESLAIGLWNSMLCSTQGPGRAGRCGEHFSADMAVTCPGSDAVFYTGPDVVPGPPPISGEES
jgi:phospholipase B1